ncbi:MAG: DUF6483 family protein [Clostridium sp.]|nr:DUF6483 family protein [Clostridium sp.]MDY3828077.1 DUF6483 family protein [Clostridium sp.]
MLKTDYKREVENTLKILTDKVDEALIEGKEKEVIPIIESEIKSLVGIDLELLNTLSFESATEIISRENQYNFLKYIALGEALKLMGIVYFSINEDSKGLYYYEKASEAFFEADAEEDIESEYHKSIEIILDKLSDYELEISYEKIIFRLYQIIGYYDKAEDMLFSILKKTSNNKEVIDLGINFYNALLEKSDEELERGNLPREEIAESKHYIEEL